MSTPAEVKLTDDQKWGAFFDIWYSHADIEILELLQDRLSDTFKDNWHYGENDPFIKAQAAFLHFEIGHLLEKLSKFGKNLKAIEAEEVEA
jgi:hypothetical protein